MIIDNEFRDVSATHKYPFADYATMSTISGIPLPASIFIDASFYIEGLQSAVYLYAVEEDEDKTLRIIFKDETLRNTVAQALLPEDSLTVPIHSNGVRSGSLVVSDTAFDYLHGSLNRGPVLFGKQLPLDVSVCFSLDSLGLRSVVVNDSPQTGPVNIVCESGVVASPVGDGVSINLYG